MKPPPEPSYWRVVRRAAASLVMAAVSGWALYMATHAASVPMLVWFVVDTGCCMIGAISQGARASLEVQRL